MAWFAIFIFGVVQGVAEFLPISSSGHLTLLQYFWNEVPESLSLNIAVHLGTLVTILYFYRAEVLQILRGLFARDPKEVQWVLWILCASFPTAILGLTVKKAFPFLLTQPVVVGLCLLGTGCVLFSNRWVPSSSKASADLSFGKAFWIGVIQGIAVLPGFSRSGLTITLALWLGVERATAARFSFLISVPAILGAALLEAVSSKEVLDIPSMLFATVVSGVVGLGAIYLVVWLTKNQRLSMFSYYMWGAGLFVLGGLYLAY